MGKMAGRFEYVKAMGAGTLLAGLVGTSVLDHPAIAQAPAPLRQTEPIPRAPKAVPDPAQPALVGPTEVIPRRYKSWSLFLICGPGWILRNKDEGVSRLYQEFEAFGDAIGRDNVAIWFWKSQGAPTADNVDVGRSAGYCEKYNLLPSGTPQVLVTTRFPDDPGEGDKYVVSLNGLSPSESANALDKLTDQLMQSGLNQKNLDNAAFWNGLLSASGTALSAAGCYLNKVSISLHTGVINAEVGHSGTESCSP
jgi:hypothetical protein